MLTSVRFLTQLQVVCTGCGPSPRYTGVPFPSCLVDRDRHVVGSVYDCVMKSERLNPACRPPLETENVSKVFSIRVNKISISIIYFSSKDGQKLTNSLSLTLFIYEISVSILTSVCLYKLGCINNMYNVIYCFFH